MAYYPKSQIKTNLYTNGGEYVLFTTQEDYIGDYYEVSNGETYSGKSPNDSPNELIIKQPTSESPGISPEANKYAQTSYTNNSIILINSSLELNNSEEGDGIKRTGVNPPLGSIRFYNPDNSSEIALGRSIPLSNLSIPTQKDYNLGEFQRYFAKKNNQNIYLEISKETCDQLKNNDPKIAFDLYTAINLPWNLSGERDQTYLTNKNVVTLIEERNKWYGFTQWFKDDFLKYYQNPDIQTDLFTDGTEFINRRTKLAYRGPYHIHPEKGPMVGAKHIQREHDYLDPIQPTPDLIVDPTPIPTPTYSGGGGSTSSGGGGYSGGGGGY